jgi:polyisoprenoid-binding protein YceI
MNRSLLLALLILASCKTAPKAENAIVGDPLPGQALTSGITYTADVSKSSIEWVGTKPTGHHHGTLRLREGILVVDNNTVRAGSFSIDINSLSADDQKPQKNEMLQQHLLSDDFFDAKNFPAAAFEISSIIPADAKATSLYKVTGNLKLKDITKSISFPATIIIDKSVLTADANFNFDRTLWNMNYGNDKSLGNWFIRPDVNIKLHLVARRSEL